MELKHSSFQFTDPILKKINFEVNDEFNNEKFNGIGEFISSINVKRSQQEDNAVVTLNLTIGGANELYPFCIDISMEAIFTWKSFDEETINELLKLNAPSLLLSYMRPHISSITNSSKYPVFNLPFIDFNKSVESLEAENKL